MRFITELLYINNKGGIKMYLYSIMGLNTEHVDEICEDIKKQYDDKIAGCVLFNMTLVPEGNPPINKAELMCEKYDLFRDKLEAEGYKCGILVQATIGHGYKLNNKFLFQPYVNLNDGTEESVCCPYDEDFRKHFYNVFSILASHRPSVIMVDDDLRLMCCRDGRGCACPLHMAEFNRRAGTKLTREELYSYLCDDKDTRYKEIFLETQKEALVGAVRAMREGIDRVDPSIQGIYCTAGGEFAAEMAREIAGKGHPVIVRLNNGNYTAAGARLLSKSMLRAAQQIAVMRDKVDVFLAETDTCPQNRYSTSAQSLHAQFTGSIIEGVAGAKHWITRLSAFEPVSGKAYRKILSENSGFYEELSKIVPDLKPLGCRIPLPDKIDFKFNGEDVKPSEGWAVCVLERLGIPMYFSEIEGGAVFLDSDSDLAFSDAEIKKMLSGCLFLASDTAEGLIKRGFGEYLGVDIREWSGARASGELIYGNVIKTQFNVKEIVAVEKNVISHSTVYNLKDGNERVTLFPGVTEYKNLLGGTVFVFSGTPKTEFHYTTAFSFLNETRKLQLVNLLKSQNQIPAYYTEDAEVYLRAADMADGGLFLGVFNIGLDPLEEIPLWVNRKIKRIEMLSKYGKRKECEFEVSNEIVIVKTPAYTLNPVILFIY